MPSPPPPTIEEWLANLDESVRNLYDALSRNNNALDKKALEFEHRSREVETRLGALEELRVGWEKVRTVVLVGDSDFRAAALQDLAQSNSKSIGGNAEAIKDLQEDLSTLTRRVGVVQHTADFHQRLAYANIGMTAAVLFVLLLLALHLM